MTKRWALLVDCSLCGTQLDEGAKSETIGRGRKTVELELCGRCTEKLDKAIEPFIAVGRRPDKERVIKAAAPNEHHELTPAQCPQCRTWFPNSQGAAAHMRACDGKPPPYPCPEPACKTAFRKEYLRNKHVEAGVHVIPPAKAA